MNGCGREAVPIDDHAIGAAARIRQLEERIEELEWLLGRKALEVEILKEALSAARAHGAPVRPPTAEREDSY